MPTCISALNSHNSLEILKLTAVISIAILAGHAVVKGVTNRLHQATIQQCQEQAWPAHQHAEHVAFCDMYLAGETTTAAIRR